MVKSVRKERMIENQQSLEFDLDAGDIKDIAALDQGKPLFFDHSSVEAVNQFVGFNDHLKQILD